MVRSSDLLQELRRKSGCVSQKGGVGNRYSAAPLGREAIQNGLTVKIAALDTQQETSIDRQRMRLHNGIEPVVPVEVFATAAQALDRRPVRLALIDAPARTSRGTLEIARVADLVVQPTGASADDLRPAFWEFHALVKAGIPKSKLTSPSTASAPRPRRRKPGPVLTKRATAPSRAASTSAPATARRRTSATPKRLARKKLPSPPSMDETTDKLQAPETAPSGFQRFE